MPLVAIAANDIDTAGLKLDAELPAEWLCRELADVGVERAAPGRVTARLSRSGSEIVVRGEVNAKVTVPCARCLGPTTIELPGELSLLLKPVKSEAHPGGGRGGSGHGAQRAGSGGAAAGSDEASMWARAAARSIPEWGEAARGRANGSVPEDKGKSKGKAARGKSAPPSKKVKDSEYEFSAEEAEIDTYDGETVVLDSFLREALLLELPNFPLCSEACPGIRPVAPAPEPDSGDAGERVDPRLLPLGALRAKLGTPKVAAGESTELPVKPAPRGGSSPRARAAKPAPSTATKKQKKKE